MSAASSPAADPRPLALTIGDAAGIGPELVLQAWLRRMPGQRPFFALADPDHLTRLAQRLGWQVPIATIAIAQANASFANALPVVPLQHKFDDEASSANTPGTLESMQRAVEYVYAGQAAAIVTCPIAKDRMYQAGFQFPGHTEFLGAQASQLWKRPVLPVMMLWAPELAVVPVTVHVPLARVPDLLTTTLIIETTQIVIDDLRQRFGIQAPRIAVAGLNPHAGENATIGTEDRDIIAPAIRALQAAGHNVIGPMPADTMFHAAARKKYDAAICMYHDQALIPIKTLAFDHGVNTTLGLPFVRTSPDHGTAFDIAGRGIAKPDSLLAALALAARLA
ncbi:MAG: 4-hydroxythreonine-4-phosphate dehydrogenase PdxA [Hyphomicrobiales bacterium]|nr:4-hydroxythreonine-4-phosphate dehydrogenase PdxA [Hyphomicrobiales bacterium]MDE2113319.1 4-hydroxythreonine-4-phosphate dehydrogenase PdxA [Hyphomicrobiales bacterium]